MTIVHNTLFDELLITFFRALQVDIEVASRINLILVLEVFNISNSEEISASNVEYELELIFIDIKPAFLTQSEIEVLRTKFVFSHIIFPSLNRLSKKYSIGTLSDEPSIISLRM